MLRNGFYSINSKVVGDDNVNAEIQFNVQHPIFGGHFPGQPIVPGVCMMQIVKDFTEDFINAKLTLTDGENIKFLSVIDPMVNNVVQLSFRVQREGNLVFINASLFSGALIFFKFKGTYSR